MVSPAGLSVSNTNVPVTSAPLTLRSSSGNAVRSRNPDVFLSEETVESPMSRSTRTDGTVPIHQISAKHLDRYLDEFEFRYNNRTNAYLFRDVLLRLMDAKAMPYEKLTKSA